MKAFHEQNYYELLDVSVGANEIEIRAASDRLLALCDPDSVAMYGLVEPEQAHALKSRLIEAVGTLTDLRSRTAYDRSLGIDEDDDDHHSDVDSTRTDLTSTQNNAGTVTSVAYVESTAVASAVAPTAEGATTASSTSSSVQEVAATLSSASSTAAANESETPTAVASASPAESVAEPQPSSNPSIEPMAANDATAVSTSSALPSVSSSGDETPSTSTTEAISVAAPKSSNSTVSSPASAVANVSSVSASVDVAEIQLTPAPAVTRELSNGVAIKIVGKAAQFEIPAEAECNGEFLRRVRESRGLSLEAIAEKTRISKRHIENVEADRYSALPATVYLRGILMNLARELRIDGMQIVKSYIDLVTKSQSKP